jgi:hypothetical protein
MRWLIRTLKKIQPSMRLRLTVEVEGSLGEGHKLPPTYLESPARGLEHGKCKLAERKNLVKRSKALGPKLVNRRRKIGK